MKVEVNQDTCVGCGACVSIYPDVFSFNDDGLAVAITEAIEEGKEEVVEEAIESCPTDAILKIND